MGLSQTFLLATDKTLKSISEFENDGTQVARKLFISTTLQKSGPFYNCSLLCYAILSKDVWRLNFSLHVKLFMSPIFKIDNRSVYISISSLFTLAFILCIAFLEIISPF